MEEGGHGTTAPGPPPPARRSRAWVGAALVALALLAPFALRGPIVTALAARALEEPGVRCPRIALDVAWDLSSATAGPTTCRFGQGAREVEASVPSGATVTLAGLRPTGVSVPELTLALPVADDRELEDVGQALLDGNVPEPLQRGLDGLARLAEQREIPPITVDAIRVRRGARTLDAYDFVLEPGGEGEGGRRLVFRLGSIAPPALGERRLEVAARVAGLEGEAERARAQIRGRIELVLELGPLGVTRGLDFRLDGHGLDGSDARYELWLEEGERLREIRDHLIALRARRAERLERRQERSEELAGRVHALADRLRERMGEGDEPDAGSLGQEGEP